MQNMNFEVKYRNDRPGGSVKTSLKNILRHTYHTQIRKT